METLIAHPSLEKDIPEATAQGTAQFAKARVPGVVVELLAEELAQVGGGAYIFRFD